ncbi:tRNA lysidine(34) synthetase TilS [Candidatus Saccharibacteria bacterium]|nr:tRNA lysidine(34) synthetase TilS [Candidatus Saccharibacteria bacterium]
MKKILAVSGGIDSMVMLDIFLKRFSAEEIVVATFDHGARESSKTDADFVEKYVKLSEVCSALKIRFYRGEAPKTQKISEEKARALRYDFLRKIAFRERGEIFTAHHLDDLVETVAINFIRGTGIRGLAPLSSPGIRRPFIDGFLDEWFDKKKILRYATVNDVVFRQDPTNTTDEYLRNRIRARLSELDIETKLAIYELWKKQRELLKEIDTITENVVPEDLRISRESLRRADKRVALEILREATRRAGVAATRPQLEDFWEAICEYAPGKKFNLPGDKLARINKNDFWL